MTKQKLANIMPGLPCDSQLCDFVSADGTLEQKLQHLSIHSQTAHPVQQHHQGGGAPRGKVDWPTLRPVSDLESWEFFRYEWANYKTVMGITGGTTSAHLYGCLDEELKKDLQKSNQRVASADMTEAALLEAIKKLAVKQESKLAHRIKMGKAVQSPRVSIRIYHSQLKGLATACEYTTTSQCQCSRNDHEILADLLGDEKTDRSTTEIVDYIARKEQAKAERGTVCGETPVTAAVTPGATPRRGARPCRGCDGPEHGWRSQRISDCQQCGHGSGRSKHCKQGVKNERVGISVNSNSTGFVMSELAHITHKADFHLATVGSRKGRTVPLTHHIFKENFGWVAQPLSPHPTLSMITTACPEDHDH